jgi:hypothetical protein
LARTDRNSTYISCFGNVAKVPSGGRGIGQDGDGRIGPLEGLYATPPAAIVFGRDGTRQTVIDLMQLVREIQVGVDVEGDGHVDLGATRITYVGHSAGAIYGTVLLAIEPSIRDAIQRPLAGGLGLLAVIAMGVARRCLEPMVEGLLPGNASGWSGSDRDIRSLVALRLRDMAVSSTVVVALRDLSQILRPIAAEGGARP